MGIDMSNYKMIYKDQVFNVVGIVPIFNMNSEDKGFKKIKFIEASVINEDGELAIINDEAWMFKFVRR